MTAPTGDDRKVAAREAELDEQLRAQIAAAGEAGWRSPFYTGECSRVYPAYDDRHKAYAQWREARDQWTQTGETRYLAAVVHYVDWSIPPDPSEVVTQAMPPRRHPVQAVLTAVAVAVIVLFVVYGLGLLDGVLP